MCCTIVNFPYDSGAIGLYDYIFIGTPSYAEWQRLHGSKKSEFESSALEKKQLQQKMLPIKRQCQLIKNFNYGGRLSWTKAPTVRH